MKEILKGRQHTILKLSEIVHSGYVPCRGNESYPKRFNSAADNAISPSQLSNCLVHACFNLTNKQFVDYAFNLADRTSFTGFYPCLITPRFMVKSNLFDFVESTGLKVSRSHPNAKLKNNQWLVSLYFGYDRMTPDFHFMLKEKSGMWSCKDGFTSHVFHFDSMPEKYDYFDYYNSYKITNPFAKEK